MQATYGGTSYIDIRHGGLAEIIPSRTFYETVLGSWLLVRASK